MTTSTAHALPQVSTFQAIELHECTKCGTLYDPRTADYDTGDDPVCDSCVIARYPDIEADQDYMVFEHGIALF